MGVQKRGPNRYEAFTYVPKAQRKPGEGPKRYIGTYAKRGDAVQAFEDAKRALRGKPPMDEMTVGEYAERWLEFKHGPGTRRPAPMTRVVNRQGLQAFLTDFADMPMHAIRRNEALDWCLKHPNSAKPVSAMYQDAVNDDLIPSNPFANRQQKQKRGRKDIQPLTEAEVEQLATIAEDVWGAYGKVCKAWILFSAWVGTRPGETFSLTWDDLDLDAGLVSVKRCKPPYNVDVVPVAQRVREALLAMPVERTGHLFTTVRGLPIRKGSYTWYWDRVRVVFESKLEPARRDALREGQPAIALYSLRHFCASIIVARGGNEFDISAQLGNSPDVAREVYFHDYRSDRNKRLRGLLDGPQVTSLDAARHRKMGGSN
jgi:integrase